MTHPGHGRTECSCGVVLSQCLCNDQHKEVRVVQAACDVCRAVRPVGSRTPRAPIALMVEEACSLLRRAGLALTAYEARAPEIASGTEAHLLEEIGAFLARVDPG